MSELCRHLGLTSSTLSASVTATPKAGTAAGIGTPAGTARGKKATAVQPIPPKGPNADKADNRRGDCGQPAPDSTRRDGARPSALCGKAVENPYAAQAPSADPASEAGAGAASSEQQRVGNPAEKSRPTPRSMTLLPRRRIFYSSTFVRSVPLSGSCLIAGRLLSATIQMQAFELQCPPGLQVVVHNTGFSAPRLSVNSQHCPIVVDDRLSPFHCPCLD